MKKLIFSIITLVVIFGLTRIVSDFMHAKMIDYAFVVGLIVTIIIRFFTSSGGYFTNSLSLNIQTQTGMKINGEKGSPFLTTRKSFSFLVSLAFTIISLLTTVIYYWKEF
ncbi:hypothetical protein [Bacillus sp. EAC]|uniref:hypothetical protein n=1 Tax=Bacillus sp. EAC TaxID=1978338 RepID=UPI000B4501A5|nr:hypothetical protein [Bacillus sp. EAC]